MTKKKIMKRNYDDPEYKKFRIAVLKRDRFFCQWPGCGSSKRLNVHHIKTWTHHPGLRYDVSNGVTLCRVCHGRIWRKEDQYIQLLTLIARRNAIKPPKKPSTKSKRPKSWAARYTKAKQKEKRK